MKAHGPINLQNQNREKRYENDFRGDHTDYKICRPLTYHNNYIKTGGDFDLWNI